MVYPKVLPKWQLTEQMFDLTTYTIRILFSNPYMNTLTADGKFQLNMTRYD